MSLPKEITASEFDAVKLLTDAELAVLTQFGNGLTSSEIASVKGAKRSVSTIEAHLYNIRNKLRQMNNARLRVFAARFLMFRTTFEVTIVRERTHQKLLLKS